MTSRSVFLPLLVTFLWLCGCVTGTLAPTPLIISSGDSKIPSYDELVSIAQSHSGSISFYPPQNLTVSESCQISLAKRNISHPKQFLMFAYSGQWFDDLGNFDACEQLSISHHCSAQFTIMNVSVVMGLCIPKNCTQEDMLLAMPTLIGGSLGVLYGALSSINIINASTLLTSCASQQVTWQHDTNAVIMVSIGLTMVVLVGLATIADHLFAIHDYNNEFHHHHDLHDHTWNFMATSTHAALADLTHSLHPHQHHGNDTCVYTHLQSDDYFQMEQQQQHQRPTIPPSWRQLITSFSAIHNIRKLMTPMPKSNVDMSCLNGIRVLSLIWVIMGHTLYYEFPLLRDPLYVVTGVMTRISFQAVMGAFFAVDSFFFLSGFLGAYYLLPQLTTTPSHKFPKLLSGYYFHRYIRITPIYIWWLMWDWKVSKFMGAGQSPLHFLLSGGVQGNSTGIESVSPDNPCNSYWWANLLYINNFIPSSHSDQCFPWSWYLANDMQFAIILPFLIYLYSRYRLPGIVTLLGIFTTSCTYVGMISHMKGYSASMLDINNIYGSYDDIYGKPYGRIQPFIMGILFALLLHIHPHRIPNRIYRPCIVIAAFLMTSIIFGPAQLYHSLNTDHILNQVDISELTRNQWTRPTHDLYMATSRGMWGLGLGFLCYSMIVGTGEDVGFHDDTKVKEPGSYVRTFLSHPIWTPLARLSYQAYLIHEIWINYYVHQFRNKPYYSDWSYAIQVIAHVVMAFVWSAVGYILIEKPIMNLTNWLLNTLSGKNHTPLENDSTRQE